MTILPIVILDSQTVIFAEHARGQAENNVTFQWAFGAIRNSKLGPQFEAITRDTVMKSGDQIKFFLRIENKCFVYLIYHSSQGDRAYYSHTALNYGTLTAEFHETITSRKTTSGIS